MIFFTFSHSILQVNSFIVNSFANEYLTANLINDFLSVIRNYLYKCLWNRNSEKKQQPFVDLIVFVVVCIVLYLMHKPKVFTDFLMIDVMELLFLIELICTIFIDLKGKK